MAQSAPSPPNTIKDYYPNMVRIKNICKINKHYFPIRKKKIKIKTLTKKFSLFLVFLLFHISRETAKKLSFLVTTKRGMKK